MTDLKTGDFVKIIGQDTIGEVISLKGNQVEIAMGPMKMMVKRNRLQQVAPPASANETESTDMVNASGIDTKQKLMDFQFELDLRGKMKEEVMEIMPPWLDDAILLGLQDLKVIHGRGVIKDTVRAWLRQFKEVESVTDAPREKGGEGSSLIRLKK
ncbi:MAG: Smr/MutS family protein [Candidatus Cyclobacteriaceae bacterium M3_2C_046]